MGRITASNAATATDKAEVQRKVSDQELLDNLTLLLEQRGAVDFFVSDALLAIEQRMAELRMERNRLAHGAAVSVHGSGSTGSRKAVEIGNYTEDDLRDIVVEIVQGMLGQPEATPETLRRLQVAADDDETAIADEQGHSDHP